MFPGESERHDHKPPESHRTDDAYAVRCVDSPGLKKRLYGPSGCKDQTGLDSEKEQRRDEYSGADRRQDDDEDHEVRGMGPANHVMRSQRDRHAA